MIIKKAICILAVSILIASCKKDEKTPAPAASSTPSIQNSPYAISSATVYSGILSSYSFTNVSGGNSYPQHNYSAVFYNAPAANSLSGNMIAVNSIMLNNMTMNYNSNDMVYSAIDQSYFPSQTWQVQGANGIPSFNYTNANNTPGCANFNVIPDSVSISSGFTITLNNVVNTTGSTAIIYISDGSNSSAGEVIKPLQNGNNVVSFTAAELSNLQPGAGNSFIGISLENEQVLNFYGKDFRFLKTAAFTKWIELQN